VVSLYSFLLFKEFSENRLPVQLKMLVLHYKKIKLAVYYHPSPSIVGLYSIPKWDIVQAKIKISEGIDRRLDAYV